MTPKEYEKYSDDCEKQGEFYRQRGIDSFAALERYRATHKPHDFREELADDIDALVHRLVGNCQILVDWADAERVKAEDKLTEAEDEIRRLKEGKQ